MRGVFFRFRAELRQRWRAWVVLAVLLGATAGLALVLAAGARRTASAPQRFLGAGNAYDVAIATYCDRESPANNIERRPRSGCHDELRRLPAVAEAATVGLLGASVATLDGRTLSPDPEDECFSGPGEIALLDAGSSGFGRTLNRRRFVAGRAASPNSVDEVVVSEETADRLHLRPGDRLRVQLFGTASCDEPDRWRPPIVVRIVGIQLSPGEVRPASGDYRQSVEVTPAFVAASRVQSVPYLAVRLARDATVSEFQQQAADAGYEVSTVADSRANARAVSDAARPSQLALLALAILAGVGTLVVVGQLLVRRATVDAYDNETLGALGMTSGERLMLGVARGGAVAATGAAIAVTIAVFASPTMPIGIARRIEPHPGFAVDVPVLLIGALITVIFGVLVTVVPAMWRRPTTKRIEALAGLVDASARAGAPTTAVAGAELALTRGSGRSAVPVLSSFVGLAMAIAVTIGALTFAAGLVHLRTTPRLVGWNWDVAVTLPDEDVTPQQIANSRDRLRAAVAHDRRVVAASPGLFFSPFPNGRALQLEKRHLETPGLMAFDAGSAVGPSMLDGHKPVAADEIALGPDTVSALGLHIGDDVDVFGQAGTWAAPGRETKARMRIVGTVVMPSSGHLGVGAAMTLEGLRQLNDTALDQFYLVRVAPGTDTDDIVQLVRSAYPASYGASQYAVGLDDLPDPILKLDAIDAVPAVVAILTIAMAVALLVHVLLTAIGARRRDLAILRVLGFTRGQTIRMVGWQAAIYVVVALTIGIPIGVVAGRFAWRLYARGLAVVPEPVTPWTTLALVALCALVAVTIVAIPATIRAVRTRPAALLRSE
jgi:ABC-type lipoprotein release transport system permease subunit